MTRASQTVALAAGVVTVLTLSPVASASTIAAGGTLLCLVGARREHRLSADLGGATLWVALVAAGFADLAPTLLVLGTVGAIGTWDASSHALGLATQLEPEATTTRGEMVHAGLTLAVTAAVAAVVLIAYVGGGGLPLFAGVLVVVGAGLVAAGLAPGGE